MSEDKCEFSTFDFTDSCWDAEIAKFQVDHSQHGVITKTLPDGRVVKVIPPAASPQKQFCRPRGSGKHLHESRKLMLDIASQIMLEGVDVEEFKKIFNASHGHDAEAIKAAAEVCNKLIATAEVTAGISALIKQLHLWGADIAKKKRDLKEEARLLLLEFRKDGVPAKRKREIAIRILEIKNWRCKHPFIIRRLPCALSYSELKKTGFDGWVLEENIPEVVTFKLFIGTADTSLGWYLADKADHARSGGSIEFSELRALLKRPEFIKKIVNMDDVEEVQQSEK